MFLGLIDAKLATLSFELDVVVNHVEQNRSAKETLIADKFVDLYQTLLHDACLLWCRSLGNQTIELNLALNLVTSLEPVFRVYRR